MTGNKCRDKFPWVETEVVERTLSAGKVVMSGDRSNRQDTEYMESLSDIVMSEDRGGTQDTEWHCHEWGQR